MKMKHAVLAFGACASLALAGTLHAQDGFTGLSIVDVTDQFSGIDGYEPGWMTFQYFAHFSQDAIDAGAQLRAFAGEEDPLNIVTNGGEIFRHELWSPVHSPSATFIGFDPLVEATSFFAFGQESVGFVGDAGDLFLVAPGSGYSFGSTTITSNANHALLNVTDDTPDTPAPIGTPDDDGKTLILQVTIDGGDPIQPLIGNINIVADGFDLQTFELPAIPAPGALALLGVAGLIGVRRRRA